MATKTARKPMTDAEFDAFNAEFEAAGRKFISETFATFIAEADGWSASGRQTGWLFFHTIDKARSVATKLQKAGWRNLRLFESPESAQGRQLAYTLTVDVDSELLATDLSRKLMTLLKSVGFDPVYVADIRSGKMHVMLDRQIDIMLLARQSAVFKRAGFHIKAVDLLSSELATVFEFSTQGK